MTNLEPGWIALIFARNLLLAFMVYGFLHLRLYMQRAQGGLFKFNPRWLDTDHPAFLFRNQTVDRHRQNILDKLGMRDRVELTRYAIRRGLIQP